MAAQMVESHRLVRGHQEGPAQGVGRGALRDAWGQPALGILTLSHNWGLAPPPQHRPGPQRPPLPSDRTDSSSKPCSSREAVQRRMDTHPRLPCS